MSSSQIIYIRSFVLCGGRWRRLQNIRKYVYHVTSKKWALDTRTARLRDASLCVAGSQAARRPERLGGQGGCPRRMPRWLYQKEWNYQPLDLVPLETHLLQPWPFGSSLEAFTQPNERICCLDMLVYGTIFPTLWMSISGKLHTTEMVWSILNMPEVAEVPQIYLVLRNIKWFSVFKFEFKLTGYFTSQIQYI